MRFSPDGTLPDGLYGWLAFYAAADGPQDVQQHLLHVGAVLGELAADADYRAYAAGRWPDELPDLLALVPLDGRGNAIPFFRLQPATDIA